jgi:hypothetical protein
VVSVRKNDVESNEALIRRFVRKVQSSGNLILVKKKKYRKGKESKMLRRRSAIRREELRQEKDFLRKIGKLDETRDRKGKR